MAKYINWKSYQPTAPLRIESNLFSSLSPRWYPVNIIGSEVEDIFAAYAQELSSASVQAQGFSKDADINFVRTSPVGTNSNPPIYTRFGEVLGVPKLPSQAYETFTPASLLMSYRGELRTLLRATRAGASTHGLALIGQAFTGIAPILIEPMKEYRGWKLTSGSGVVAAVTDDGIIPTVPLPRTSVGILPTPLSFSPGNTFYYSWSKLGFNTQLRSAQYLYSGAEIYLYGASDTVSEISASVENLLTRNLRGDIYPRFAWSDMYAYTRPDTPSGSLGSAYTFLETSQDPVASTYINFVQEYTSEYVGVVSGSVLTPYNVPGSYYVAVTYLSGSVERFHELCSLDSNSEWRTATSVPAGIKIARLVEERDQVSSNFVDTSGTTVDFLDPIPPDMAVGDHLVHPTTGEMRYIKELVTNDQILLSRAFTSEWTSADVTVLGTMIDKVISTGTPQQYPVEHIIPLQDPANSETFLPYTGSTYAASLALLAYASASNTGTGDSLVSAVSASVVSTESGLGYSGAVADIFDAFSLATLSNSRALCLSASWAVYSLVQYFIATQNTTALSTAETIAVWLITLQQESDDYLNGLLVQEPASIVAYTDDNIVAYFAFTLLSQVTGKPQYMVAGARIRSALLSTLYDSTLGRFVASTTAADKDYAENASVYSLGGLFLHTVGETAKAKTVAVRALDKFFIEDTSIDLQNDPPNHFNQDYSYIAKPLHGFRKYATTTDGETGDTYVNPPSQSVSQIDTLAMLTLFDRLEPYALDEDVINYYDKRARILFSQDLISRVSGSGVLAFTASDFQAPYSSSVWPSVPASVWWYLRSRNPELLLGLGTSGQLSWTLSRFNYIQNTNRAWLPQQAFITDTASLPEDYASYNWYPDFFTLTVDDGAVDTYIQAYPSASVPPTVGFIKIDPSPSQEPVLPTDATLGSTYLFDIIGTLLRDTTGYLNNLTLDDFSDSLTYRPARNTNRIVMTTEFGASNYVRWSGTTNTYADLSDTMTCEMWVSGINANASSASVAVGVRRQSASDTGLELTASGYLMKVDTAVGAFIYAARSGSVIQSVSCSVRMIGEEESIGWHNFSAVRASGSVSMYIDGILAMRASMSVTPPVITSGYTEVAMTRGVSVPCSVAIDALSFYNIALTREEIADRYEDTMPHLFRGALPSSSVSAFYRAKVLLSGSAAGNAEFHQFSMRGLPALYSHAVDLQTVDVLSVPIFASGSL